MLACPAARFEVREQCQRLREVKRPVEPQQPISVTGGGNVEGARRTAVGERALDLVQSPADLSASRLDAASDGAERRSVAGQAELSVEGVHGGERVEELPNRIGREAEVEMQPHPLEEMV